MPVPKSRKAKPTTTTNKEVGETANNGSNETNFAGSIPLDILSGLYFQQAKKRARKLKTKKTDIEIVLWSEKNKEKKELVPGHAYGDYAATFWEGENKKKVNRWGLTHIPSGSSLTKSLHYKNEVTLRIQMILDAEICLPKDKLQVGYKDELERLKNLVSIWDDEKLDNSPVGKLLQSKVAVYSIPTELLKATYLIMIPDLAPKPRKAVSSLIKEFNNFESMPLMTLDHNHYFTVSCSDRKSGITSRYKFNPGFFEIEFDEENPLSEGQTIGFYK